LHPFQRLIADTIRREGPLTFARYMDLALYHPQFGYYMRGGDQFGEEGDFVTAPTLSPLLARALAEAAHDAWSALGRGRFRLVEYGPGRGELMRDLLAYLAAEYPELFERAEAVLVEVSPALARRQRETLAPWPGKVAWAGAPVDASDGMVIANEFVDALPCHRVRTGPGGLSELYVGEEDGCLVWVEGPLSDQAVETLAATGLELPPGHAAEVCPAARSWLAEAARWLERGFLLVVDYGMEEAALLDPARAGGTVRSFRRHRLVGDVLSAPGQQDITAHVNFSTLARWGRESFGHPSVYTTQGRFILHSGILERLARGDSFVHDEQRYRLAEQMKMLMLPGGMGEIFKVMAFYRGDEPVPVLRGMAGARALP